MLLRQLAAAFTVIAAATPLAAQSTGNAFGDRIGDRLHTRNGRAVTRITTERPRVSPSADPQVGPNIRDGYLVLPDTTIVNPAVSGTPRDY